MKRPCRIAFAPILAAAFLGCNSADEPAKPSNPPAEEPPKAAPPEPTVRDMKPADPRPEAKPAEKPADGGLPELAPPAGSRNEATEPKPK